MNNAKIESALVLGSIAFDYIMNCPNDYYETLSINHETREVQGAFQSVKKLMNFGGTAGNIAYNMAQLGGKSIIAATVGPDFSSLAYKNHLEKCGIDLRVEVIDSDSTASCYIFNDVKKSQLIIFHGGALNHAESLNLREIIKANDKVSIAINAPNNMPAMVKFSEDLKEMSIPCIFDPGQMINALSQEQFDAILPNSSAFISNEHELNAVEKKFKVNLLEMEDQFDWIITTLGSQGSRIHVGGEFVDIPVVKASRVQDPTGAGDAFRGGMLYGLTRGLDIVDSAKIGAVMGSLNVEHDGGQSYVVDIQSFKKRFEDTFNETSPV